MDIKRYLKNEVEVYDIETKDIIFDESVRGYCKENKCGRYNNNFMCPPDIGSVEGYRKIINSYNKGYLLLIKDNIHGNIKNIDFSSQRRLHELILELEDNLKADGYEDVLGFIAGECKICSPCRKKKGYDKCIYPDKARTSLEAVGVNVVDTLKKKDIEIVFGTDEITWVGIVLIK